MTGCSSCWDGIGTFDHRFASVTCFHWNITALSLNMQNDFTRQLRSSQVFAAGRASHIRLHTTLCTFICVVPRWPSTLEAVEHELKLKARATSSGPCEAAAR
eukprot:6205611-Pleurochrysis_carterae.AAC.5